MLLLGRKSFIFNLHPSKCILQKKCDKKVSLYLSVLISRLNKWLVTIDYINLAWQWLYYS